MGNNNGGPNVPATITFFFQTLSQQGIFKFISNIGVYATLAKVNVSGKTKLLFKMDTKGTQYPLFLRQIGHSDNFNLVVRGPEDIPVGIIINNGIRYLVCDKDITPLTFNINSTDKPSSLPLFTSINALLGTVIPISQDEFGFLTLGIGTPILLGFEITSPNINTKDYNAWNSIKSFFTNDNITSIIIDRIKTVKSEASSIALITQGICVGLGVILIAIGTFLAAVGIIVIFTTGPIGAFVGIALFILGFILGIIGTLITVITLVVFST